MHQKNIDFIKPIPKLLTLYSLCKKHVVLGSSENNKLILDLRMYSKLGIHKLHKIAYKI